MVHGQNHHESILGTQNRQSNLDPIQLGPELAPVNPDWTGIRQLAIVMPLTLINWNVQWATPASSRGAEIRRRIFEHGPDIVCVTETHLDLLSPMGHAVSSESDYGYGTKESRRKIVLWSKEPWEQVDNVGLDYLPPGRFVSGVTHTALGEVRVIGICIPWAGSRVGRVPARRRRWEDHEQYLSGLAKLLERTPYTSLMVVGDFNQRIGGDTHTPKRLREALQHTIPPHLTVATSTLGLRGRRTIDHTAISHDLAVESLGVIDNLHQGKRLSDHFGVFARLSTVTGARASQG